jgi:hypothetical protein
VANSGRMGKQNLQKLEFGNKEINEKESEE